MFKSIKGASLVEYGLLVGLIAIVALAGVRLLGQTIGGFFNNIAAELTAAVD